MHFTTVTLPVFGQIYVGATERGIAFIALDAKDDAACAAQIRQRYHCEAVRDDADQAGWQALLERWLAGDDLLTLPLDLSRVTLFERQVLKKTREIPRGSVRTYAWLAREVGKPRASRAVGNTMARNPIPLLIPCHRVITSTGAIGNYSSDRPELKRYLLEREGVPLAGERVRLGS